MLIGDSMGELFAWYAAADVAFIGGSLLDFGSQNLIEACAVGTPVLLGPSTFNFADAAEEATARGAARRIATADELVAAALELIGDGAARARMGAAGLQFATDHRGATARTLALLTPLLAQSIATPASGARLNRGQEITEAARCRSGRRPPYSSSRFTA